MNGTTPGRPTHPGVAHDAADSPRSADPLADRYGTAPRPGRRTVNRVLAAVGVVVALGVALMVALNVTQPQAHKKDVGFQVHGPDRVSVTFEVTTPADRGAICRVTALAQNYAQVGVLDVTIPPNDGTTVRTTVDLATVQLAVTGTVERCDLLDD